MDGREVTYRMAVRTPDGDGVLVGYVCGFVKVEFGDGTCKEYHESQVDGLYPG